MPVFDKNLVIKWIVKLLPISVITFIVIWLFFANYEPGTWLSGWDTLHPEFNFPLYWQRIIDGAWQYHQGLGAPAAQAHIAEIPRVVFLYILSWFLPDNMLRYAFMFFCLWLGSIGVYSLTHNLVKNNNSSLQTKVAALLSSMVYLLNMTVIQQFYVPLEMFAVHFAMLPWIVYSYLYYLKKPTATGLFYIAITSFLGSSMAHTATIWYVMMLGFGIASVSYWLFSDKKIKTIFAIIIGLGLMVVVNLFWIIPNFHYIYYHSDDVSASRIHASFSEEAFLQGKNYGTWQDLFLQRNFLFNWKDFNFELNQFEDMLSEWKYHYNQQFGIQLIVYAIWLISFYGLLRYKHIQRSTKFFAVTILVFAIFFWINQNPPFTNIFSYLRQHFDLFREGIRFPFTKFSIMLIFAQSVLFAFGIKHVFEKISSGTIKIGLSLVTFCAIIFTVYPAFTGNLINPEMRVEIPNEYFDLFDWFENQDPEARVAKLPLHSFWGWNYYKWGYQGAGFTWFGIPQPTMDREFDRWAEQNESFYNEISHATYGKDWTRFNQILDKYNITYLLMDGSLVDAGTENTLYLPEIEEYLSQSTQFSRVYENSFLRVYQYKNVKKPTIYTLDQAYLTASDTTYVPMDPIYDTQNNYLAGSTKGNLNPFVNLDGRKFSNVEVHESEIILTQDINPPQRFKSIVVPNYLETEQNYAIDVFLSISENNLYQVKLQLQQPYFTMNGTDTLSGRKTWVLLTFPLENSVKYISIADEAFEISDSNNYQNTEKYIGTVLVDKSLDQQINFYADDTTDLNNFENEILNKKPRDCRNPDEKYQVKGIEKGEIRLEVNNESICQGSNIYIENDSLLDISFKAKSNEGLYPWFCISSEVSQGCINDIIPKIFHEGETRDFAYLQPIVEGRYWFDFVAQAIEKAQGSISFSQLNLKSYPLSLSTTVNFYDEFNLVSTKDNINLEEKEISSLKVHIPTNAITKEDFSLGRGNYQAVNCNIDDVGTVTKNKLISGSINYTANDNGVSCDFFDYNKLKYNQGYLLHIQGKNNFGRSLKIYLRNHLTNRSDVEEVLNSGSIASNTFIYPSRLKGNGYTLNLETRAYGKEKASNTLSEIGFYALPINWLGQIYLESNENSSVISNNNLQYKKIGLSKFRVNNPTELLILDQTYDPGWGLYTTKPTLSDYLKTYLSNISNNHLLFNSWGNGWVLENKEKNDPIYIVYLPQQVVVPLLAISLILISFLGSYSIVSQFRFKKQ